MSSVHKLNLSVIEERLRFETLLADLSSRFVNVSAGDLDGEIEEAQRRVCECLGLDVAVLWQWCDADPNVLALTHLYRRFEGPPVPADIDARESFPWALDEVLAGRTVRLARLEDAPPEARVDREMWQHFELRSVLVLPLAAGGGPIAGVLSFHTVHEEREWPDEIMQRLRLIAEVFANALVRKQSETALRESEARLQLAAESAKVGLWMLDVGTGRFWANARGRELFGYGAETDITTELFLESVRPDCRPMVAESVRAALESGHEVDVEYMITLPDGRARWIHSRGRVQEVSPGAAARLLGVSVDVTERRHTDELRAEQLRFEILLSELSARFVGVAAANVDGEIERALQEVGAFFGCDRCGIMSAGDGPTVHVTHAWYDEGVARVPAGFDLAPGYPWTLAELTAGRAVGFAGLDELPPEAALDRKSWAADGVTSSLVVPLPTELGYRSFIVIQSMGSECVWPLTIVSRMQLLGSVFLNALERKTAEEALRRSHAEIEDLKRRLELENVYLQREHRLLHGSGKVVGESPAILQVLALAEQVAPTDSTVLIEGETGTGKELIAQRIHELSPRSGRPMVKVNCAALPSTLVESELFGREKGAYTGAVSREAGRFEVANGSTLFLDEIAELPIELQAKLLRVLEEGRFERVGSSRTMSTDVRVIAATNRDLKTEVEAGRFRRDLYFRLAVFPIRVPPLRERRGDIPLLVWSAVESFSAAMNKSIESIRRQDLERLQNHDWPGNVRELRNVVERAMIVSSGPTLQLECPFAPPVDDDTALSLDEVQRRHIAKTLEAVGGRIAGPGGAAERLGMKPTTLRSRMQRLGFEPHRARSDRSSP